MFGTRWEVIVFSVSLARASVASLLGTSTIWLHAQDTKSPPPLLFFFSSDLTSAPSTLGRTYGKCVYVNWLIHWLEVWLYFRVSRFLTIPLLPWSREPLHNWQTCKSIACLKIAGWAWEPDRAKVKSATVWLNQCEPCVVSTFQGLDNEKHTVYSLSCCLHNWLVWSQVSTLLESR